MENSNEGWMASAESFVVDAVVLSMKNCLALRSCWKRTAPTLRLLNKHWYREVNRHVVAIGETHGADLYAPSVSLPEEAVDALLKFPNLTWLDISGFTSPENCPSLLRTVKQMPKLDRLVLGPKVLDSVESNDLRGLECRTLGVRNTREHFGSREQVLKLSKIRMEQFIAGNVDHGQGWIVDFLAVAPSVKKLTAYYVTSDDDLEAMRVLEELELGYRGRNTQSLATLTSIVSLNVIGIYVVSLEPFMPLTRLKTLGLQIANSFIFDRYFGVVTGRLTELKSVCTYYSRANGTLPQEFWEALTGIEKLKITDCAVDTGHLNQHDFVKLRSLTMIQSTLEGSMTPWNRMTSLTSLDLWCMYPSEDSDLELLALGPLKNLRRLSVHFRKRGYVSFPLLLSIPWLTKLEELDLFGGKHLGLYYYKDNLESLKDLPHLTCDSIDSLERFISANCSLD